MEMYDKDILVFMNLPRGRRKRIISKMFEKWHELEKKSAAEAEEFLFGLRALDALHHAAKSVQEVMDF